MAPDGRDRGSDWRLVIGALLIIVALATALFGFVSLIRVLEGGGYGTDAMRGTLVILGSAGALLSAGIAIVIWDVAKRYETPAN
jgi:uncharacterized membrane protein